MSTAAKPKMGMKWKLRRSCCDLPMRDMSCWSEGVPSLEVVEGGGSTSGVLGSFSYIVG